MLFKIDSWLKGEEGSKPAVPNFSGSSGAGMGVGGGVLESLH